MGSDPRALLFAAYDKMKNKKEFYYEKNSIFN